MICCSCVRYTIYKLCKTEINWPPVHSGWRWEGCVCRMLVSSKNCRDPDFSPFSSLRDEWRSPVKSLASGSCINYRSARWTSIQLDAIQLYTLFQCLHRHAAPGLTYSQTSTCKQTLMDTTDTTFLRIAWIKAKSVTRSVTLYYS